MRKAPDSSVAIAALWGDHPAHEIAAEALATCKTTIAHAALETYSVLTRLPPPHRADATAAAAALNERLPKTYATLDAGKCSPPLQFPATCSPTRGTASSSRPPT